MFAALVERALASSWYDPGDNGFDIGDALDLVLIIGAIYAGLRVLIALVRKFDAMRDRRHTSDVKAIMAPVLAAQTESILATMKDLTQSIEPGYKNAGSSLTDISAKVDTAIALGRENHTAIVAIASRLEGVEAEQVRLAGNEPQDDAIDSIEPLANE